MIFGNAMRHIEDDMATLTQAPDALVPEHEDREGPLPRLLFVLTFVTGLVDAVSFLKLGSVFVANMTGNIVFLGFAVADAQDFSVATSLTALAAFLVGALAGGLLGSRTGQHRGRFLASAILIKIVVVALALLLATASPDLDNPWVQYGVIGLLALAMGIQNATARRLAVADLTTTVLTLTLTGLAADSSLAGGTNPRPARRLAAVVSMFLGAAAGALLVLQMGVLAALALTLGLLVLTGLACYRASSASAPWTVGV
jgi:uncharacterized membrane protein YoaK (UPF0700 family)